MVTSVAVTSCCVPPGVGRIGPRVEPASALRTNRARPGGRRRAGVGTTASCLSCGRELIETAIAAAIRAVTALSANVIVNADSAGTEVSPIVRAVSRAAPTWPPTTAPIMRTTVFMPLATPISRGSTLSAISPAIEAKAAPTPSPRSALASSTGTGSACMVAKRSAATLTTSMPVASVHFEP